MKAAASFHAIDYNDRKDRKGNASLVHVSGFGPLQESASNVTPGDLKRYLQRFSDRNTRIRNPQFHAILSVRGQSLSVQEMVRQGIGVMQGLGYGDNPMVIYAHFDTRNRHIHIVSSRVGLDGRKISDQFEGIRAQRIINASLGIDPGKEFGTNLCAALEYRFSSLRQFELLMERRGYRARREQNEIHFFRHGNKQGCVSVLLLEQRMMEQTVDAAQRARIRGILLANMNRQDCTLVSQNNNSGKKELGSELTEMMHRRFGLQFVFFSSAGHDRPYGYAIIDHANRMVHKGGDVLLMSKLIGETQGEEGYKRRKKQDSEGGRKESLNIGSDESGSMLSLLDEMARQLEGDLNRDLRAEEQMARRKNGKKRRGVR